MLLDLYKLSYDVTMNHYCFFSFLFFFTFSLMDVFVDDDDDDSCNNDISYCPVRLPLIKKK